MKMTRLMCGSWRLIDPPWGKEPWIQHDISGRREEPLRAWALLVKDHYATVLFVISEMEPARDIMSCFQILSLIS